MVPAERDHPITRTLPAAFKMQYDSAPMLPGPQGRALVLLKREAVVRGADYTLDKDYAALIVGTLGKGRVVLFGPLAGQALKPREMERPPTGGELQMMLNSILWAAGKL